MKEKILEPEQIIIPGEYDVANETILKIYFRVFDKMHGKDLPPVFVAHKDVANMFSVLEMNEDDTNYWYYRKINEAYNNQLKEVFKSGAEYFLLDGNHKSIAATLTHKPIRALEILTDQDLKKGAKMVESGKLFNWTIPGETITETMKQLKARLYNYTFHFFREERIDDCPLTIRERVDKLIFKEDLPQYMIKRYLRRK